MLADTATVAEDRACSLPPVLPGYCRSLFVPMFRALDRAGFDGWLNVELDGSPRAPRPPKEAAAMSYRGLTEAIHKANAI